MKDLMSNQNTKLTIEQLMIREVAQGISYFPQTQALLADLYETNKYSFYALAVNSPIYHSSEITKYALHTEVDIRHNIGVLLAAETDDFIFEKVKQALFKSDPRLKDYIKKPTKNEAFEICVISSRPTDISGIKLQYISLFVTYIYNRSHSELAGDANLFSHGLNYLKMRKQIDDENIDKEGQLPDRSRLLDVLNLHKEEWKFLKTLTNADTITHIRIDKMIAEAFKEQNLPATPQCPEFYRFLSASEQEDTLAELDKMWNLLLSLDVNWSDMFAGQAITRDEQTRILLESLPHVDTTSGYRPHHYVSAFMLYTIAKELQSMRAFYWEHNEETQYLETQHLLSEQSRLTKENESLHSQNKALSAKIAQLQKEMRSAEHSSAAPYKAEIARLQQIIADQEKDLKVLKDDSIELMHLRSMALSEDTSDSQEDAASQLVALSQEKKIVVIGGHLNWRNKLSADFPGICFIDGTSSSTDFKSIENSDIIIFFTYNMAHTVYEKIIAYVRQNQKPFGYLPRITNSDIFASELLHIIQSNL